MPFFLPSRLVDFEYFGTAENNAEYEKVAKPYQREIDFAFFVVNFGFTKADYEALTPKEIVFIYKAWENKKVSDLYDMYNAVSTAVYNVQRPKNKKALQLLKKRSQKANMDSIKQNLAIIREMENKKDYSWVEKIYKANNLKYPERRVNG